MVATNITWHNGAFTREERQKELGQKVSKGIDFVRQDALGVEPFLLTPVTSINP